MRTDGCWKSPDAGKDVGQKDKRALEMRWLENSITNAMNMNLGKLREMVGEARRPGVLQSIGHKRQT